MFASVALGPGGKTLWVGRFLSCTAAIVVQSFGWVHVFISLSFTNILCKSICILVLVTESDTPSRGQVSKPLNFCKSKIQTKPFLLFIPWKGGYKLPCNPHYCHFVTTCRKWTLRTGCCGLVSCISLFKHRHFAVNIGSQDLYTRTRFISYAL